MCVCVCVGGGGGGGGGEGVEGVTSGSYRAAVLSKKSPAN